MTIKEAFEDYKQWAKEANYSDIHIGTLLGFGRRFKAAYGYQEGIDFPGQVRIDGIKATWVLGVCATSTAGF